MGEEFTSEEKDVLSRYFSNLDKPVFVLRNLPEVVKGALFSRYSRSTKSIRRLLLDEFINNPEMAFKEISGSQDSIAKDQVVATQKAEEFYDRVLVGYGDDSVAELGGAHIACEQVSNLATKVLEDARLGLSPLEKSSRYVFFNQKNAEGKYNYYRDPSIMQSSLAEEYEEACDFLFDTYSELIDPMQAYFRERFPQDSQTSDRAYQSTIRAKAADTVRGLLPASTQTNVGIYGNGRAYEYLIGKMYAHPLKEMNALAKSMQDELTTVIPSFVKRAGPLDKYGAEAMRFWGESRDGTQGKADEVLEASEKENALHVELVDFDDEAEGKIIASVLYQYSDRPKSQLRKVAKKLPVEKRREILNEYLGRRTNRRQKPGRAFENTYYTFDVLANYGAYRDLQRHRVLTQERQDLSTRNGYTLPPEIVDAGFKEKFKEPLEKAAEVYEKLRPKFRRESQYVVPFAYNIRWYMTLNLRELYHFTELRSTKHGHPDYRKVAQEMFLLAKEKHPLLLEHCKFVDLGSTEGNLERLESERKIDKKLEALQGQKP